MIYQTEAARARTSAAGMESQTPSTPRTSGSVSTAARMNTKVLRKERMAETLPLDRAVNLSLIHI